MKKNKALTAAFSVFALTMVSMCAIGGTFAKYATEGSADDTARVAQWGVTVTVTGDEAFAEKYDNAASATGTKVVSVGATNDLIDDSVLAPGTNGTLGSVSIVGQPEVMVDVAVSLNLELSGWAVDVTPDDTENPVYYCPLVISDGTTTLSGLSYNTADEFEEAVEALVNYTGNDLAANSNLARNVSLNWSWAYETGADDDAKAENNVKDTALGDLAVAPTITATWSASVEQVD